MSGARLISIAGVVGVGKTTLARGLAKSLDADLIEEAYDKNPFLGEGTNSALACQLSFLLSRREQLCREKLLEQASQQPGPRTFISDYIFEKDRIFAAQTLDEKQYKVYRQIAEMVEPTIIPASGVIYLQDTMEACLERIAERGRPFERSLNTDWLSRFAQAYESLMADWKICPVVRVDRSGLDLRDSAVVERIGDRVCKI
ncbi:MAG: deoxynucleoside kinase [Planctomycetes bacterium]|nr:deoxynucleoside kinase [Planctomycetota bacterium]